MTKDEEERAARITNAAANMADAMQRQGLKGGEVALAALTAACVVCAVTGMKQENVLATADALMRENWERWKTIYNYMENPDKVEGTKQ